MKLQLLTAVAVTALMAVPSLATANDQGWYVRGNVGYGAMTDMDLTGDIVGDVEAEANGVGSLGVGYAFGNNWRIELDGTQLWNDLGQISQAANTTADMRISSVMMNAIYDFQDFGAWTPYVGAGFGMAKAGLSAQSHGFPRGNDILPLVNNPTCPSSNICAINDSHASVAWQLIAGLGYDITEKLVWDTQYRYLDVGRLDFIGQGVDINGGGILANAYAAESSIGNAGSHSLMTGLRYKFGAPAVKATRMLVSCWNGSQVASLSSCPAEPARVVYTSCWDGSQVASGNACPARPQVQCWDGSTVSDAASCPTRTTITCWDGSLVYEQASCPVQSYTQSLCANEYRQEIIYYEFNKPQSAETREKIQRILDTAQYCAVGNINVVGHTDTSGSAAYNLGLSKRRASDVRKELIRQGVSNSSITSEGKGETQLFIDTGDNVKEALNRRTEVLIRLAETGVVN